ncbi:hypothetical protein PS042_16795 [Escherichia albertii]|uniref:hypothetical protein n=1 Tax=Escherichia albertii TaxID=208962 RepID=UPI000721D6CC|nr:hypothetical protein [Escherichia albertii]EFZ2303037.1 hypothetical protein [Shigella boydii]EFC7612839.1 hypothetical protein [Escherichia albertii]EFG1227875.1 hypothetical protein [Escherichia albertii]EFO1262550.1 hypothetical protein [Escherichia albertii]EFZ6208566.1 hypothetical protein [Shigella boydii]
MPDLLTKTFTVCLICFPACSFAEDAVDKANNPLHLATSFAVQDYYTPGLYNSDQHTNDMLLRATVPISGGDLIPVPQIMRLTVPISTRPQLTGGYDSGIGDINLFDIFLLKQQGIKLGIGPLLTANSAAQDELGTGQWQAGLAAVVVDTMPRWLRGALIQWQKSFTGDNDRNHVETATLQPFLIYKMSKGWFLRSSGTWTWNVKTDDYYIPAGLGIGRAMPIGNYIVNSFIEPQWTVAHSGDYQPQFTIYAGISIMLK